MVNTEIRLIIFFVAKDGEALYSQLLGSSPGGSSVIQRGDGVGVLGKNLFNYRYIERLETDSVVGNISGEKDVE